MDSFNLDKLFSQGYAFRIPDYQRGYAWKDRQLDDLWEDILDMQHKTDGSLKPHYTGMLCIEKIPVPDTDNWARKEFYNVVDGQQRLTTILILLSELLYSGKEFFGDDSVETLRKHFLVHLNDRDKSKVCLLFAYSEENKNIKTLERILTHNKTISDSSESNTYRKNLLNAQDFFNKKVSKLDEAEKEIVFKKVTTGLFFDVRKVEDDMDVQMVFETMNNRGKPLSTLEKLKNRLIYLIHDNPKLRVDIQKIWGNIYTLLGKSDELNENRLLADFLSVYRLAQYQVFSESESEEKVFQIFSRHPEKYGEEEATNEKIQNFINGLGEFSKYWVEVSTSQDDSILRALYLSNTSFVKIFLAVAKIYVNCSYNKSAEQKKFEVLQTLLLKILFRNRIPGAFVIDERALVTRARELYSFYYKNDVKYEDRTYDSLDAIIEDFNKLLASEIEFESFKSNCVGMFDYVRGKKGFYRWGDVLKYFLIMYEYHLQDDKDYPKIAWKDFYKHSLEHVLPQDQSNWPGVIDAYISSLPISAEEIDKINKAKNIIVNSLGNFAVVPLSKNESLGNQSWEDKRRRYATGTRNETELLNYEKWDDKSIYSRGKVMLNYLLSEVGYGKTLSEDDYVDILFREDIFFNSENPDKAQD